MSVATETASKELRDVFSTRLAPSKLVLRLRGSSTPPALPPNPDLVKALSPGDSLDSSLTDFTATYTGITQAFDQLLREPYLEQVVVKDISQSNLRATLLDASGKFQLYASREVGVARNLIALANMIPVLLANRTIADFVHAYSQIISQYANGVEKDVENKRSYFEKLLSVLNGVGATTAATKSQLTTLSKKLQLKDKTLQKENIVQYIRQILAPVYKLSLDDDDAQVQLGVLLSVSGKTLDGTFGDLFQSSGVARSIVIKAGIDQVAGRLGSIMPNLSLLAMSLVPSLEASEATAMVWTHIADNIETLKGLDIVPEAEVIDRIGLAWKDTAARAEKLVSAITSAPLTIAAEFSAEAPYQLSLPLPETKEYLALMKLVNQVDGDPYIITDARTAKLRAIASSKPVRERLIERAIARFKAESASKKGTKTVNDTAEALQTPDDQQFRRDFGPPDSTADSLERLSGDCLVIIQKFDNILTLPYLDSLQVDNPFRTNPVTLANGKVNGAVNGKVNGTVNGTASAAGEDEEPEKINIQDMVIRYKNKYELLQQESVTLIRDLITYSSLQAQLLPKVTVDPKPTAGQIALPVYLQANKLLIDQYSISANETHLKYVQFKNDWHLAQLNLEKAIKTAQADVARNTQIIKDLKEEQKQATLYGILGTIGAIALFALGAFTLPFGLLALAGGAVLLTWSIKQLEQAGKLDDAIGTYEQALQTAEEMERQLTLIQEPMQSIADSIVQITNLFFDISANLQLIRDNVGLWEIVPILFTTESPEVIRLWGVVKDLCDQYVRIISGGV